MKTLIHLYLTIMLTIGVYSTINTYSVTILNVELRILTINDKPYRDTQVTVAYNTYYLSNSCREHCSSGITDSEGYVKFINITAQQCTTGYCIAVKINIPIYNLEFTLRNTRVIPPNTSLVIKLPFIDVRDRNLSIVDEFGNPLNGTFSIYYGDTLIHKIVFVNGAVDLHDSPYPLLSYINKSEVLIEYSDGVKESKPLYRQVEFEYTVEISTEGLETPYVKRVKSSELVKLSKIVLKTDRVFHTETSLESSFYPDTLSNEAVRNSTWRSWFDPSNVGSEEESINKFLFLGPIISVAILVYEGLLKRRRRG